MLDGAEKQKGNGGKHNGSRQLLPSKTRGKAVTPSKTERTQRKGFARRKPPSRELARCDLFQHIQKTREKDKMRTTGKKLICYTSRKRSLLRDEIHSKLKSSNKTVCKISYNKRCNFKPRMSKRILNGQSIETPQKLSGHLSTKRQSSSKVLGKKTSCLGYREYRKNAARDSAIGTAEKRKKRKRKKRNAEPDEASRLQRRVRYLLIKMKLEQNLIDAYSGDGWKGQSREKIKPEKELQRAEKQILKCKLGIRDAIHQLDLLSSEGSIEDSVIYPDGSVLNEHIFCAKCKSSDVFPDNDIILCDGTCNCGFHQKCLEPPLERRDQGWLCKFCEYKTEILGAINAHLGTCFTVNSSWEDIFKEATRDPDAGNKLHPIEEYPSEDSEDEDYYPERTESSNNRTGSENESDDDCSSSGLFCSSDEARPYSSRSEYRSCDEGSNHVTHKKKFDRTDSIISIDSSEGSDREITGYRRQRRDVDYKKLHDEMFGKDPTENEQQSEDEDWGPRRKKRREKESNTGTTVAYCGGEAVCRDVVSNEKISPNRKPLFRIPANAVEKLRQVFAESELPSRAVKESLSKQLGISSEKVSKWFKNARYSALKTRKAEMTASTHITNTAKRSRTSSIKNRSSEEDASMDDSCLLPLSSIIHVPRNLRRILRRNTTTTPLRKKPKRAANAASTDKVQKQRTILIENQPPSTIRRNFSRELGLTRRQVSTLFPNAVDPKRQANGLRSNVSSEKTSKTKSRTFSQVDGMTDDEQLYLVEISRLCNLEDRVRKLKKALFACDDSDQASSKTHSREQRIIYVPVAEIKEKK